ncbi:MAG TPA: radical SAM protein [Verrucomicrobiota bacterium]|nr:radical SAM protein [Verrucomicrobiota bacterium]HNU52845.1 radical SAM protein [Verrucomicrobiota bacterium]
MRVLLVNTNRMKPAIAPVALDYLADSLEATGCDVHLLDLCFSVDTDADIAAALNRATPDVIGLTVRNTDDCYMSGQAFFLPEIRRLIGQIRAVSPNPVVLGGVGFSVAPEAILDYCGADFGVRGDGETALVEFVRAFEAGREWQSVPNLIYRDHGRLRQNPPRWVDLAQVPPRRRAFLDNPRYFREGGQAGFETKRGCTMGCIYCADPVAKGRTRRLAPPALVVGELSALHAQGIDHGHTCDSEFNLPLDHARAICQAIVDAHLGSAIRWYAYCAPAPFPDDFAALCRRAGCVGINFGVDSGSNDMLRRLGRHFTADDLIATAAACRRHGLRFMYDLLLGGPGETRASVRETIDLMRRIQPDCVGLSLGVRVYEGTPLARTLRAESELPSHPHLHGAKQTHPALLEPVFYLSPELGTDLLPWVRESVAGDPRFFLPADTGANPNYNYSENAVLVRAIANGARGAYWDILSRGVGR